MAKKLVVPESRQSLNQMKEKISSELGLSNYQTADKGNLTARQNGSIGGNMTKRLVEMAQQQFAQDLNRANKVTTKSIGNN